MNHVLDRRRRSRRRGAALAGFALTVSLAGGALAVPASAASPEPGPWRGASAGTPAPYAYPGASANRGVPAAAPDAELRERVVAAAEMGAAPGAAPTRAARTGAGPTPFLIGGTETSISSAPWMVQLGYYDEAKDEGYFCGGTLVAADKVLTAAHCVSGLNWSRNGAVLAGATKLDDAASGTVAGVHRQWQHPKYSSTTLRNDIAVLTLDRALDKPWLRLAASDDSALYKTGTSATVYGWGLTSGAADATLASKLRKVTLPMVADSTCNTAMKQVLGADWFAEGSMVCAGTPASGADAGTKSTCSGDSGGPLVVGGKIAGIVSWGAESCTAKGAYPVFTKVSSYVGAATARINDTDLSWDGKADLMARTPSGGLFQLNSKGSSLATPAYVSKDWQSISWGMQTDLDRDGYQDLLIRDKTDGKLYRNYLNHSTGKWAWMQVSSVWGGYSSYAIPGDLTGDGRPDLMAVDSSGNAYLYPGKGNGQFYGKVQTVKGSWKGVKLLGHGDLNGDGKADLLVVDRSKTLWLYRGTGKQKTPFSTRIKARTGWNFTAQVANGDMNGDGIADILARTSSGTLYLYPGTGKASSALFGARKSLGTSFNKYNALF
ncbi:trypsin-like serine protease [Streptomyces sp. NPDC091292]|uniref:trypsin-like serine protease n=1 Tax=Streptomyces sp. NPDC091292 TaxID=3365991 RepID=UPI0037F7A0E9